MRIYAAILLCSFTILAFSQNRLDHLGINEGLSQSSVNDIFQDSEGFMWFATQDGLNKFDGYEFEYYTTESDPSLAGNFLWSIVEDKDGNIWTASATGATRLDWRNEKSTKFYVNDKSKNVSSFNQVSKVSIHDGVVSISFDGNGIFSFQSDAFQDSSDVKLTNEFLDINFSPSEKYRYHYNSFFYDSIRISIFHKFIKVGSTSISFPENILTSPFSNKEYRWKNGFFLATEGGLIFVDVQKKVIMKTCIDFHTYDIISSPEEDHLWIATLNGLYVFNPNTFDCEGRINSTGREEGIKSSHIATLFKSREGLYWIGTANGGISIFDPKHNQFKSINEANGHDGKPVWSSLLVENKLFLGTDDGILEYLLDPTQRALLFPVSRKLSEIPITALKNQRVCAISKFSNNQILIGTASGLIVKYDHMQSTMESLLLPERPIISSIIRRGSTIWVTSHRGIFELDLNLQLKKYHDYFDNPTQYPTNYFLSTYLSKDGVLWVGSNAGFSTISTDGQFKHYLYDEHEEKKSPNHYFVTGFHESDDGSIWMATFGGGVSHFDRLSETFTHLTVEDGLINNTCASIEGDGNFVFVGTNGGLSVIEKASGKIKNFTKEDGLLSNEFAIASSTSVKKDFLFGVVDGLITFNSDDLDFNFVPNSPIVTSLDINYRKMPFSRLSRKRLDIYPSDKIFSLAFSDLSKRKRDQTIYEYRLVGFNDSWIPVNSSNRRATYSLAPDDYQFQVRTVLGGEKSDPRTLLIKVHPAFYQTWWFISLSSVTFIGLIVLASRYYSHQSLKEKLRKLEVQQKIQNERERISRDLHDNVGSQITYIASSLDHLSVKGDANEVRELGDFTRDTMRQLRETIWVINHDQVTIEELKNKVVDYLSEVLKNFPDIVHHVSFPTSDLKFNPTKAINIFRIVQEAVNNAIKHANPKKIEVQLVLDNENSITISDDGKGFSGEDKSGHFGLINMRSRAQEIGGKLQLDTSLKNGTIICVSGFKIGQMT